jgi:antirestriction protein ArdC
MEQAISSNRQDRVRRAHDQVDAALERLAEALRQGKPEDLVSYLRFWGSFHRYSYHNAMLILSQKPDATHVAGFHAWRKVGRFVRKGEHGIAILYARIHAREDLETGEKERRLSGFGVGYVFDVTSTEGATLPEAPAWRTQGPANTGDVERIADEIRRQGITLRMGRAAVEERIPGADGVTYRERDALVIAVRDDFDPAHTVHTLLHELAHATLHFGTDRSASREQRELEADAVALAVAAALGYDFTETTYRYLAGWDATAEGLAAVLPRVGRGVQTILRALGFADEEAPESAA